MITEADTCRKYVLPKLVSAGWDDELHSFTEQRSFTDGRIVVAGRRVRRGPQKRAEGETAAELDALLPSVLDRAFKGKL